MMLNSDTMELDLPLTHSETESGFSDCGGGAGPDGAGPGGPRGGPPAAWNLESRAGKTCST